MMDDINLALTSLDKKQEIDLGSKTTSFQQWADALTDHANSDEVRDKVKVWSSLGGVVATKLPVDFVSKTNKPNTYGQSKLHIASLNSDTTQKLLSLANVAYRTEIEDLLLAALVKTVSDWSKSDCTGSDCPGSKRQSRNNHKVYVQLEGHGRGNIGSAIDVTSTLGWFTSVYPVLLDVEGIDVGNESSYGDLIQSVKEQLRHVGGDGDGLSFGLLRYLSENKKIQQLLSDLPSPEIVFNYLGQLDNVVNQEQHIQPATESVGEMCGSLLVRHQLLDINCRIEGGQFQAHWTYNSTIHDEATIVNVANTYIENLSQLVTFCLNDANRGLSPSDVPLIKVDQPTLDNIVKTILVQSEDYSVEKIQSIYPLSPMQEGMLFHSIYQPESAFYMDQMELKVEGGVDLFLLAIAWQRVVDRHDVLRTAFIYNGVKKPVQVVFEKVEVAIDILDWSGVDPEQGKKDFDGWLIKDQSNGFNFSKPGLLRFAWLLLPNGEQRLVWTFHHILLDGWSLPLVLGEVMQTYSDLLNDKKVAKGPVPQFENFIGWLADQSKADGEEFWREYLKGYGAPNEFPQMKTIPFDDSSNAHWEEVVVELDKEKLQRLNAVANEHHLTLNTIIQGVWAILLGRYSRESDVVFGTTVSGRPTELADVEQIVGIFINTLPLRTTVDGDAALIDWLKKLQQDQVDMRRYEHMPLVDVQSVSEVPSKLALFESIVVFENYPMDESFFEYLPIKFTEVRLVEHANYPLTLIVAPGETMTFKMSYNESLFDKSDIQRMLGHLIVMLEGVLTNPNVCLKELPWLTPAETIQVTKSWNDTYKPYAFEKSLMAVFQENAVNYPNHIAVSFGNKLLSYRQLNEFSNMMARCLVASGVKPHDTVAIAMDRSLSMIISTVAVLKAGGAYVPVDTSYPDDRIAYMLADTASPVLITTEANRGMIERVKKCMLADDPNVRLPEVTLPKVTLPKVIVWEELQEKLPSYDKSNLNLDIDSSALAYVIYTSGSTGKPKGVSVSQKAVSRLVINTNYLDIQPGDTLAHISNVSFDAATLEIWGALLNAGEIVSIEKSSLLDADKFSEILTVKRIKAMFITVALFNLLTKQKIDTFSGVHTVLFGGEAGDPNQVRNVLKGLNGKAAPKRLMNGYGPSENTTFSTYYHVESLDDHATNVPIGVPIANSTAYILDERQNPVPIGVPGELYVGGLGVADGYFNQPELTQERFVPDPYSTDSKSINSNTRGKLYRTGDICRFRADGNIELIGRIDDQVKIRGFRIELGEVESNLKVIPGVRDACVLVKQDNEGDKQMVAYVLLDDGVEANVKSLKIEIKKRVPNYLVPSAFMFIDSLPMTANGKVDKRALPDPDDSCYESKEYVMPKNDIERQLAVIWQEVLELKRVSVNDDFFDLGGHSLLVTQVVSRVREEMGVELRIRSLFEATTIASVAEIISVIMPSTDDSDEDDEDFEELTI
ncbi:MAG: amino acid adenylation domain-containing protein [Pseudomonadales bacterium]|nr:amino acid adenylation domain-containing protein [Pseudomonadales bacterium]